MRVFSIISLLIPLVSATEVERPPALRDLAYHPETGELIFSQLKVEEHLESEMHLKMKAPLYSVKVNFNIDAYDPRGGLTMSFDKLTHAMRLDEGMASVDGLAWGNFADDIEQSGWSELYMHTSTSTKISNDVKMYSAGFVEGLLTCIRLSQYYHNNHKLLLKDESTHHALMNIKTMMENEVAFVKANSNIVPHLMSEEPKDPYWKQVRYSLFQLWGLNDGYNFAATHYKVHTLSLVDMLMINSDGEMSDLMEAFNPLAVADRTQAQSPPMVFLEGISKKQKWKKYVEKRRSPAEQKDKNALLQRFKKFTRKVTQKKNSHGFLQTETEEDPLDDAHWEHRVAESGRCSAFVKVTENNSDLLVGHTTWNDYSAMTRIFKYYNFPLQGSDTMAQNIAFSSYPGVISSTDDFYAMDSGLTVLDTSIEILNPAIYDKVKDFPLFPHIPMFMHIMAVNRLAKTAPHWAQLYETTNPGTTIAQWMVVDYNKFEANKNVADNTLFVVESIPGEVNSRDLSFKLRKQRFWASMNRPYFDSTRLKTGHAGAEQSHGALYSYFENPRAKIFKTTSVESLFDMRSLMQRNLYPFGGVEPNEPGHDISARMDLNPAQPIPNGGIDSKIVNRCLMKQLAIQAISGPSHASQVAFRWTGDGGQEMWPGFPHVGLPAVWNFQWQQMTPISVVPLNDVESC